jgi:hypothetical protein
MMTDLKIIVQSHIIHPNIQSLKDDSVAGSVTSLNNNNVELVSTNQGNINSDTFWFDVSDNNNYSLPESTSGEYPFLAGCVRARIEVDGTRRAKPAVSVFSSHLAAEWNPYHQFQSATEWRTVVLAVEQQLRKHEIDKWIKKQL